MWREPAIPRRGCDWKEGHGAPSLLQLSLMPTDKDHRSTQNYQPQSCAHLMYNKRCIEESDKYRVKMTYMPLFDQWCHLQSSKKVCCEGLSVPMSLGRVAVCRPSAEVTSKGGEKLRGEKFWDGERMNALHRTCARACACSAQATCMHTTAVSRYNTVNIGKCLSLGNGRNWRGKPIFSTATSPIILLH